MTPLRDLLRMVEEATKAPWKADIYYIVAEIPMGRPGGEVIAQVYATAIGHHDEARDVRNTNLIVSLRNDASYLLACASLVESIEDEETFPEGNILHGSAYLCVSEKALARVREMRGAR